MEHVINMQPWVRPNYGVDYRPVADLNVKSKMNVNPSAVDFGGSKLPLCGLLIGA
jgi:hypothetical protein